MNAEDFAAADAECEAIPGVEPDFYSFRTRQEIADNPDAIRACVLSQRDDGATFFRVTEVRDHEGEGAWIEGWIEPPAKQAPFNPPYTLNPPRTATPEPTP